MPPKKNKKTPDDKTKSGGNQSPSDAAALKAVDRTFYELTIADLNKKLANQRTAGARTEERNAELEAQMRRLDEDRIAVTSYLDRSLRLRTNVNRDLEEKLSELAKVRDAESTEFRRQLRDAELRYKTMQDELTSEIRLLTGKLNSLEEFRIQKDELLAKFDQQQEDLRSQTQKHRDVIYDIERKQIIARNQLKNEVENRLLQLSDEFAKTNEIRISAHVQRMVRENIALNDEMNRMMFAQRRLQNENNAVAAERQERLARLAALEEERDHLVRTSEHQVRVIAKLTGDFEQVLERNGRLSEAFTLRANAERREKIAEGLLKEERKKVGLLEQYVEAARTDAVQQQRQNRQQSREIHRLAETLLKLKASIRSAMRGQQERESGSARDQRNNLLGDLMNVLVKVHEPQTPTSSGVSASFATLPSVSQIYRQGDMGVVTPTLSMGAVLKLRRPLSLLQSRRMRSLNDMLAEEMAKEPLGMPSDEDGRVVKHSYDSCVVIDLDEGVSSVQFTSESSTGDAVAEQTDGIVEEVEVCFSSGDEENDGMAVKPKAEDDKTHRKSKSESSRVQKMPSSDGEIEE